VLGTLVLIPGTIDHYRYLNKIGEDLELTSKLAPWTYMLFVALMVILIGSAIFVYLFAQL
jgi:hypothetical protein